MKASLFYPVLAFTALAAAQVVEDHDEPVLEEPDVLQPSGFIVEFAQVCQLYEQT
jgi:hypothetical protein